MKKHYCDNCDTPVEYNFEFNDGAEFITYNTGYDGEDHYLAFCNEDCREEYHKDCDDSYLDSDDVSSTCINCGIYHEIPNL